MNLASNCRRCGEPLTAKNVFRSRVEGRKSKDGEVRPARDCRECERWVIHTLKIARFNLAWLIRHVDGVARRVRLNTKSTAVVPAPEPTPAPSEPAPLDVWGRLERLEKILARVEKALPAEGTR